MHALIVSFSRKRRCAARRKRQVMSRFRVNIRHLWPRDASSVKEGEFVQTDDLERHKSQMIITLPSYYGLKHPKTETRFFSEAG